MLALTCIKQIVLFVGLRVEAKVCGSSLVTLWTSDIWACFWNVFWVSKRIRVKIHDVHLYENQGHTPSLLGKKPRPYMCKYLLKKSKQLIICCLSWSYNLLCQFCFDTCLFETMMWGLILNVTITVNLLQIAWISINEM